MKLTYEKPMMVSENFRLSHSIASCQLPLNQEHMYCAYYSDPWPGNNEKLFNTVLSFLYTGTWEQDVCTDPITTDSYTSICYHTPLAYAFTGS